MFLQIVLPEDVVAVLLPSICVARALECRENFPQAEERSLNTGHIRIDSVRMSYKTWHNALRLIAGVIVSRATAMKEAKTRRCPFVMALGDARE